MAGITVQDIMNASQLWNTSQSSWADFLVGVQTNAAYLDSNVAKPLAAAWQGTAKELATGQVNTTAGGLLKSASQINTIQGLIEDFNNQLAGWQNQLEQIFDRAKANGFAVGADGTISSGLTPQEEAVASHDPTEYSQMLGQISQLNNEVASVLSKANQYDAETAAVLRNQMPTLGGVMQKPTPWKSTYSSLWQIAQAYYGNGELWPIIWNANKSQISNPYLITTSMDLVIPAIAGKPATTVQLTPAEAKLLAQAQNGGTAPAAPPTGTGPGTQPQLSPSQIRQALTDGQPAGAGVTPATNSNPSNDSARSSGPPLPSSNTGTSKPTTPPGGNLIKVHGTIA